MTLGYQQFDYSQCRHTKLWRAGFNPITGKQRLKCSYCRKYFTVGSTRDDRLTIIKVLSQYFLAGVCKRRAHQLTGYARTTVRKYYRLLEAYRKKAHPEECAKVPTAQGYK